MVEGMIPTNPFLERSMTSTFRICPTEAGMVPFISLSERERNHSSGMNSPMRCGIGPENLLSDRSSK